MSETSEGLTSSEIANTQKSTWKDRIGRIFGRDREISISSNADSGLENDIQSALSHASEDERALAVAHPEGIPANLREEYNQRRPEIEELYTQAAYYHGTGRKEFKNGEVVDILDSLIKDGGLKPQKDPFDLKMGVVETVSLSDRRPYSALYAKMHLTDDENLGYEYMSRSFWGRIFIRNTIKAVIGVTRFEQARKVGRLALKALQDFIAEGTDPRYLFYMKRKSREWFSKLRVGGLKESGNFRVSTVRSNIPGNYPILIGVRDNTFSPAKTAEYIAMYETRTTNSVPLVGFTHLEVPQIHIRETQNFLDQRGVNNLPVVPMELGEMHSSQFSPQQLIQGNPFRK